MKEAVLQRLVELRLASNIVDGERWLIKEKIPAYGGKTADELIREGCGGDLLEELERIANGGYV